MGLREHSYSKHQITQHGQAWRGSAPLGPALPRSAPNNNLPVTASPLPPPTTPRLPYTSSRVRCIKDVLFLRLSTLPWTLAQTVDSSVEDDAEKSEARRAANPRKLIESNLFRYSFQNVRRSRRHIDIDSICDFSLGGGAGMAWASRPLRMTDGMPRNVLPPHSGTPRHAPPRSATLYTSSPKGIYALISRRRRFFNCLVCVYIERDVPACRRDVSHATRRARMRRSRDGAGRRVHTL